MLDLIQAERGCVDHFRARCGDSQKSARKSGFAVDAGSSEAYLRPISHFHNQAHIPSPAPADRYGYSRSQLRPIRRFQ